MAGTHAKGSRKNRKFGRQEHRSPAMARYRGEMRWESNKRRRVARHVRRFPGDRQALKILQAME